MQKSFMVLSLAALALISNSAFAGETPRSTAQTYISLLKFGDVKGALRQRVDGGAGVDEKYKELAPIIFKEARITSIENVNSYTAIVYVSVKNPLDGERSTLPMKLIKRNGDWKIAIQKN